MRAKVALGLVRTTENGERRRQRTRHTAVEWTKIIGAQRRSSLTLAEFCRRRDLALATFGYWRRRLAQPTGVAPPAQQFLAIPLVAPIATSIEVDLGTLRVHLEGAAATRVIDAIVARIGEATR